MSGWIYGVYHTAAPVGEDGSRRIKIGKSKHHPDRDALDGRIRKLDLSLVALGFGPVTHAFAPFEVSDHHVFEAELKAELKRLGKNIPKVAKRQLTEVYQVSLDDIRQVTENLKRVMG